MSLGEKIALAGLAVFIVVISIMGVMVVNNALDIGRLLPDPKPTATLIPGVSSDEGSVPLVIASEQPFVAEEIERITKGGMDVLHVEEQGDFSATIVIWVKEIPTDAQAQAMDRLIAGERPITRLVNVNAVPQLDNMVFVVMSAYDCIANVSSEEIPLRCVRDESVRPGFVVPDEGLDLLNE